MGPIGPSLPPSLAKKRKLSGSSNSTLEPVHDENSDPKSAQAASSSRFIKTHPASSASDTSRDAPSPDGETNPIGPIFPPETSLKPPPDTHEGAKDITVSVIPDAPEPVANASATDDSDDDFGPAPPPTDAEVRVANDVFDKRETRSPESSKPLVREEWMTLPPASTDWGSRVDPTKLKNRRFNTGKSATGPKGPAVDSAWLETPEQKRQRLEDEMLGRRPLAQAHAANEVPTKTMEARQREACEKEEQVQAYNERNRRGDSLMDDHQRRKEDRKRAREVGKGSRKNRLDEEDDDPSSRKFDHEKDIGLRGTLGAKARGDMMKQAQNFGGRFSGGGYL